MRPFAELWAEISPQYARAEVVVGTIVMDCPEILISDTVIFPVCSIRKKLGLIWQVDEVTGRWRIIEVTLQPEPEWLFASLAFSVKAYGRLLDRPGVIDMTFPRVGSSYTGPKCWTVAPVTAKGTVTI